MHPAVAVLFYLCYTFAISCYSHHALLFAAGGNCRAAAEATGGFKMDQINETGTNNKDKSKNMDKIHESGKKYTFEDLREIMRTLRSENGCPWDRRQTHESLIPCLEEEAGEVIDAIRNQDPENLCEELGDLLFQVMSHSQIAEEKGLFTIDDVVDGVSAKMVRRHPNVFGDEKVNSSEEGLDLWNRIKTEEKSKKEQKTLTKQG